MNDRKIFYNLIIDISFVVFAVFFVAAHQLSGTFKGDAGSVVLVCLMSVTAFSLPMLFSGLCGRFLDRSLRLSVAYVYHRLLPRVFASTVILCACGGMIYWKLYSDGDFRLGALRDSVYSIIRTPCCLYFYPMTLLMIILYPLFKRLIADKKYWKSMSILCFIVCLLSSAVAYLSFFPDEFGTALAYIAFIMMAVLVEHIHFDPTWRMIIYGAGLLASAFIIIMTIRYSVLQTEMDYTWVEEAMIFVLVQLFAALVLIRNRCRRIRSLDYEKRYWINELSSSGYIYVFVFSILSVPVSSLPFIQALPGFLRFLLVIVISLVLTLAGCALLNRLPVVSWFTGLLQGEEPPADKDRKLSSREKEAYFS